MECAMTRITMQSATMMVTTALEVEAEEEEVVLKHFMVWY